MIEISRIASAAGVALVPRGGGASYTDAYLPDTPRSLLVEQAATKGAYLLDKLHAELDGHPHVGNVRGKGMMCGVELVEDKATKAWYPPEWGVGGKMTAALIANKIFTRMRSEVVCIAPPLTTDEATLDELVAGVRNAIVTVFGE